MSAYILRRVVSMVPVLLIVSIIAFALLYVLPGDPAVAILGDSAGNQQTYLALRHDLGLDQPLYTQYLSWLGRVLQGDLGHSIRTNESVSVVLLQRVPISLYLGAAGLVVGLVLGLSVAVVSALRPGSRVDSLGTLLAMGGVAIPSFWQALLLVYVFAVLLRWVPPSGFTSPFTDPWLSVRMLILPAIVLGTHSAAVIMRQGRSALMEVLEQDYITTARSKGLVDRSVVARHAMKNAMIPIVTVVGLQVGTLVSGAAITETVFAIPGVGRAAVDAIFFRDYPVLQGAVLILTLAVLIANLLTDVTYAYLDPRDPVPLMNALRAGGGTVPRGVVHTSDSHVAVGDVAATPVFRPRRGTFWRSLLETRLVGTGLVITAVVVLCALAAPLIAPYAPNEQDYLAITDPPSLEHPLGTDDIGRDVLSRIIYGSRVSLEVGLVAVVMAVGVGVTFGLLAGYAGGVADDVIMRVVDSIQAFPNLILALAITAALGPSIVNAMLAIGFVATPGIARLTRGQTLTVREREFVAAARVCGASPLSIMRVHIWPNVTAPIIVQATLLMGTAIVTEAALSFLGVGVQPPTPSWGAMLRTGSQYLEVAPWIGMASGAAIFVTVLAINFVGDGLRRALDPRLAGRKRQ